jgi:NAD(P)-dependent dehydrogenase (short-subunit alcohol dehydrogenase family)
VRDVICENLRGGNVICFSHGALDSRDVKWQRAPRQSRNHQPANEQTRRSAVSRAIQSLPCRSSISDALPEEGSCIINTGSITGLEGEKTLLDYAATKGAIHAFTKSLAQNLVEKKIRVNAVAPGPVWTPLNTVAKRAEEVTQFGADTPVGRPAQPEELAPAYVFLASNADSGFISGEVLPVLGGDVIAA